MDPGATPRTSTERNDDHPDGGGKTMANDTPPLAPSAQGVVVRMVRSRRPSKSSLRTARSPERRQGRWHRRWRRRRRREDILRPANRILEDFDVREKADEKRSRRLDVGDETIRREVNCSGKRRVGRRRDEAPSTLLMKKLQPQMRPPHPLKLVDVLDWSYRTMKSKVGRILFGW